MFSSAMLIWEAPPFWFDCDSSRTSRNFTSGTRTTCFSKFFPPNLTAYAETFWLVLWVTHPTQEACNFPPLKSLNGAQSSSHRFAAPQSLHLKAVCLLLIYGTHNSSNKSLTANGKQYQFHLRTPNLRPLSSSFFFLDAIYAGNPI